MADRKDVLYKIRFPQTSVALWRKTSYFWDGTDEKNILLESRLKLVSTFLAIRVPWIHLYKWSLAKLQNYTQFSLNLKLHWNISQILYKRALVNPDLTP